MSNQIQQKKSTSPHIFNPSDISPFAPSHLYCYKVFKVFPNNRISCLQAVLSAMTAQDTSCRPDFEILTKTAYTRKNVQPILKHAKR